MRGRTRTTLRAALGTALVGLALPFAVATPALAGPDPVALEAARVDRVPTPALAWTSCDGSGVGPQVARPQCSRVRLPLDYDQPQGPTVTVAVARLRARDNAHRIGSLFVNPGGPGGSATEFVQFAADYFSPAVLDRFDIVGMDPRGVGLSQQVRCFPDRGHQAWVERRLFGQAFPYYPGQEARAVDAAADLGRACSTTGEPLSASMSTAEVARDLDVVRRAVGDRQLSYFGVSYGSYLGQVYANLFPGRVRALAIDGVLDPLAWTGSAATRDVPSTERLRSGEGASKALHEILVRCRQAGPPACPVAAQGDPVALYDLVAERLKRDPLVVPFPGGEATVGYADLVGATLGDLYDPAGYQFVVDLLGGLLAATAPSATPALREAARAQLDAARAAARRPYANDNEAFSSVLCTDGRNPANASAWPAAADRADRAAPYFGRLWTWASVQCAESTWTARDEDAYRGPFTRRTSAPVLVVGNYWDPATNYDGAVTAARLLPNSRLLSSDSWGHTAYGTSACVTGSVDRYLLRVDLPPAGRRCTGDVQPFATTSVPTPARPGVVPLLPSLVG